MDEPKVPLIPDDLMIFLDELFPERSPEIGESVEMLHFRGGQRSVIRFLRAKYAEQNENITDRNVL